ncbi:MAG: hypothetical protein KF819_22550 [Labilithrix sp.]|nr:hypothetical protein [Labilithrix sp.]
MTDPDEIGRAIAVIAAALDELAVRWAIGGSVASATHGEPRATNDVDVVAHLDEASARALAARIGTDFYVDLDAALDAVRRRSSFNVIDNRSFIKFDVFVPARGPMGTGQLDRAIRLEIFPGAGPIPVLGPEDTILQKLYWYRLGGEVSDRQWRDVVGVVRTARAFLDEDYLSQVAKDADLGELLEKARRGAS